MIGAVSVKGGKWYFEVRIRPNAPRVQHLAIGYVLRSYVHQNQSLSNDYNGTAWSVVGMREAFFLLFCRPAESRFAWCRSFQQLPASRAHFIGLLWLDLSALRQMASVFNCAVCSERLCSL